MYAIIFKNKELRKSILKLTGWRNWSHGRWMIWLCVSMPLIEQLQDSVYICKYPVKCWFQPLWSLCLPVHFKSFNYYNDIEGWNFPWCRKIAKFDSWSWWQLGCWQLLRIFFFNDKIRATTGGATNYNVFYLLFQYHYISNYSGNNTIFQVKSFSVFILLQFVLKVIFLIQ